MTAKEFMKKVANDKKDLLQAFIDILGRKKIPFCVIGGLAVNAYTEPVVSLDIDVVVPIDRLKDLPSVSSPYSDLRIQVQTDARYQPFIQRAAYKEVLGYKLPVAAVEDTLQGKIWAAQGETRRPSKRQKDLADILRLVEAKKELISMVPDSLRKKLEI